MNKAELVTEVAKNTGETKRLVNDLIDNVFDVISKEMKKSEVRIVGFGTFTSAKRKARIARNPKTGEPVQVKARRVPKFRPGQQLKQRVK